jgi:hypothetical protein
MTWIVGLIGAISGGMQMFWIREAHRAAGQAVQFPWLWLEQAVDFLFGAAYQVVLLLCSVWFIAGIMEDANPWLRQITVVAIYLGLNWFSQYL